MITTLSLENYISGEIFQKGLDNTLFKANGPDNERSFLVLFSSNKNKVLASSKDLVPEKDIIFIANENGSGGSLTVNKIDAKNTKSYVIEGDPSTADGFALIRAAGKEETTSEGLTLLFPDIESKPYDILIKGKLSNTPVISGSTSFTFNKTVINFGV